MTSKDLDTRVVDPSREFVESESELKEEVQRLKQQIAEMYQSWIRGHPAPSFSVNYIENPTTIPPLLQIQPLTAVDIYLQPFHTPPAKTTSYPAPFSTHAFVAPPKATFPRSSNEIVFKVPNAQHYALEPTSHAPNFEPPGEIEKHAKTVEQDEISRKVKILEQFLGNIQGIENQVSVPYKDLCLFPDIQLSAGFKMPKFDLYDGRGDPVAHLRGYCSEMRSVCGKDELLMAYFSKSLSGEALEWYTRQDVSKWHAWGDMAQDFVRHYQYNLDIIPDCSSTSQIEKKPEESFGEFWLKWNEQVARVSPPIDKKDVDESRQRRDPVGIPAKCFQPQYQPYEYPHTPDNPSQCYFPPQNPQSHTSPSQYHIHNALPYDPHPRDPP
ncbi:uncharacterized protein [Nicotiana sylvestris]|uniref:uncharacterized protein n=1 Tax=Nicotiana sylvestris TaxID=4096 RepID=UPI00388C440C